MFSKSIFISTNYTADDAINTISSKVHQSFEFFPSKLITATVSKNRIDGVVNMPRPISDPFKNRVTIKAIPNKNFSDLSIKVKFGIINIGIILVWLIPLISAFTNDPDPRFKDYIQFFIAIGGFMTFTYFLFRLKLIWDFNRIKRWLREDCEIRNLNKS